MTTFALPLYPSGSVTLTQITEGNYSSEYFARTSTQEYRLKVRHSREKASGATPALDRHNVELTIRHFPSTTYPQGSVDSVYFVIRSNPNSDGTVASNLTQTLAQVAAVNAVGLVGWSSTLESE